MQLSEASDVGSEGPVSSPQIAPEELVQGILAGKPGSEDEMVERYSRGVRFLLLQLTRDPARADDLHQEAFRLIIEKVRAGELKEPAKLPIFIRQLAKNLFIAEYRKRAKAPPTRAADDAILAPPDPMPGPLTRLIQKENTMIVRQLLAELEPARDREILFRFFIAEHGKEEICSDYGLSSLHFNRVLHRARQRLKELVRRYHLRQSLPGRSEAAR